MRRVELRRGLRVPLMLRNDRMRMQRREELLVRLVPEGALVRRMGDDPGFGRRIVGKAWMHDGYGPVVRVEGVHDPGLNCRCVPVDELEFAPRPPGARTR